MSKYYYGGNLTDLEYYTILSARPLSKKKFSRFRGVQKTNSLTKPYRVSFKYQGVHHYVGMYADELEAARVYNESVLRIIGPHAILNDVDDVIQEQ